MGEERRLAISVAPSAAATSRETNGMAAKQTEKTSE
jgi:hypothetical protein